MLVQVLRANPFEERSDAPRWLLALSDPRIGSAIQAIHANPERRWTIGDLAEIVGVSRSTFASLQLRMRGRVPKGWLSHFRTGREWSMADRAGLGFAIYYLAHLFKIGDQSRPFWLPCQSFLRKRTGSGHI
jgi:AraC-like DNA-binding protein